MWRRSVRAFLILTAALLLAHLAWGWNAFERAGFSGPALANEQAKLAAAVASLQDTIGPLQTSASATEHTTIAILRGLYAERLREKVRQRCESTDPDKREDLNKQIDSILREFHDLAGEEFGDLPRCDEV